MIISSFRFWYIIKNNIFFSKLHQKKKYSSRFACSTKIERIEISKMVQGKKWMKKTQEGTRHMDMAAQHACGTLCHFSRQLEVWCCPSS